MAYVVESDWHTKFDFTRADGSLMHDTGLSLFAVGFGLEMKCSTPVINVKVSRLSIHAEMISHKNTLSQREREREREWIVSARVSFFGRRNIALKPI